MTTLKKLLKTYLRWLIFGLSLYFIFITLHHHWSELAQVSLRAGGGFFLVGALLVTLAAHAWSGWVWSWILLLFRQPIQPLWAIQIYLWTNIAKYLPGNIWHFYGRIRAVQKIGGSLGSASLSVLLEPLLMAAAALIVAILSNWLGLVTTAANPWRLGGQILLVGLILAGIHPRILEKVLQKLRSLKGTSPETAAEEVVVRAYPWLPLGGELGFLALRGLGFILTLMAFTPVRAEQIPHLLSVFSFSWLIGLVVPGAPGGLGVFEATMLGILDRSYFAPALVLSAVAAYRIVSIVAELIGAGLAKLSQGDFLAQLRS